MEKKFHTTYWSAYKSLMSLTYLDSNVLTVGRGAITDLGESLIDFLAAIISVLTLTLVLLTGPALFLILAPYKVKEQIRYKAWREANIRGRKND